MSVTKYVGSKKIKVDVADKKKSVTQPKTEIKKQGEGKK